MITLNVNTDASKELTRKLGDLQKSAFPNAVRGALNSAAFDVKQKTMPASAKGAFIERKANFFKANSRVNKASGWEVDRMQAVVGFTGNQQAIEDLEQQEHGGKIEGRSFIPIDTARSGASNKRLVKPNARLSQIRQLVDARKAQGANDKQKFAKSVAHAGVGGSVLSEYKGKLILWRVNSLKRNDGKFKLTPLYSFEQGRSVPISKTSFMQDASMITAKKIEGFYKLEAERQFKKYGL